jgi:hypothetical protein
MTSVTLLKGISYGSNAFDSCASLVSVTVEEGVTEIGNYMFQNTKLTSVTLPNSVTKINGNAFASCTALTTIDLGTGVVTISDYAFQKCAELTEITFPDATGNDRTKRVCRMRQTGQSIVRQEYEDDQCLQLHRHELHGRRMSPAG